MKSLVASVRISAADALAVYRFFVSKGCAPLSMSELISNSLALCSDLAKRQGVSVPEDELESGEFLKNKGLTYSRRVSQRELLRSLSTDPSLEQSVQDAIHAALGDN